MSAFQKKVAVVLVEMLGYQPHFAESAILANWLAVTNTWSAERAASQVDDVVLSTSIEQMI